MHCRSFNCIEIVVHPYVRCALDINLRFRTSSVPDGVFSRKAMVSADGTFPESGEQAKELASTNLFGTATYPYLQVTDMYSSGWSKEYLWKMMSADLLNSEGRSTVSSTEKRMELVSRTWLYALTCETFKTDYLCP